MEQRKLWRLIPYALLLHHYFANDNQNVIDWDKHTIKGTSTKLEKSYLRLTSVSRLYRPVPETANRQEPSPADIRPLHILKETLQLLKRKWKDNHNYAYALDQFKSMRQDLTVS
jgi:hypothetical protein